MSDPKKWGKLRRAFERLRVFKRLRDHDAASAFVLSYFRFMGTCPFCGAVMDGRSHAVKKVTVNDSPAYVCATCFSSRRHSFKVVKEN